MSLPSVRVWFSARRVLGISDLRQAFGCRGFCRPLSSVAEDIDKLRRRCLYQSLERGMLENDLLLGSFAKKYLRSLSPEELQQYDRLLQEVDPDIFAWLTGALPVPRHHDNAVMRRLREHVRADPLKYKANGGRSTHSRIIIE